jgi:hypothetical protein
MLVAVLNEEGQVQDQHTPENSRCACRHGNELSTQYRHRLKASSMTEVARTTDQCSNQSDHLCDANDINTERRCTQFANL